MNTPLLYRKEGSDIPYALLRRAEDFGVPELDLLRPPARFWSDGALPPSGAEFHVDARRAQEVPLPTSLLTSVPSDGWMAGTRRSIARAFAWFLLVDDPQRRLEAHNIVTLAHQASVVQHIAEHPALRRVLLADEVGLGKTIEAALLVKRVLAQTPGARILYLAPARLVRNVRSEFDKLGLNFRSWVATPERDATLQDPRVIASIHRAAHEGRINEVIDATRWDMIIVDECHHVSDWAAGGGKPVAQYKLVQRLADRLSDDGRLLLMSGTPHQGHPDRFRNLLALLRRKDEPAEVLAGRVIYRTKEDVRDWDGRPLFPARDVRKPLVIDLGAQHQEWLGRIHEFFEPDSAKRDTQQRRRAATWRAAQALQWATSSVQAGLGFLVRQAIRARLGPEKLPSLRRALAAMRPYRIGAADEHVDKLLQRIQQEGLGQQLADDDIDDIGDAAEDDAKWRPDPEALDALLEEGVSIHEDTGDEKWRFVWDHVLAPAGKEKVVLFAQPIETVTAVAGFLEKQTGERPALIVGNQSESDRAKQVESFWRADGPRFLVSSRAGGEGINLQVARRLVHLDVPWNPMDLEQRVGRVHRFMSRQTILVDTIVVKDSREVDTYQFAREKLKTIAASLVPDAKFEALFSRVMALVPPEDLRGVMGEGPVGPLSADDKKKLSELVARGFNEWKDFHDRFAQERSIRAVDPGDATWDDLASFAQQHLSATRAEGFSALAFRYDEGEIREASENAQVLLVDGKAYACGDYGGMPVTSSDGKRVARLGTNVPCVARKLHDLAFPSHAAGAAHVRWPDDAARPATGTFGLLAFVRQSVRWEGGSYGENRTTLHVYVVEGDAGEPRELTGEMRAEVMRTLTRATVRKEPGDAPTLVARMADVEGQLATGLRRPSESDRANQVHHAVTPLLAALVA